MATIIDSFVVLLGLDGRQFKREADDVDKRARQTSDNAKKTGDQLEKGAKQQREAFTATKNAVVGYFAAFVSVGAVTEFTRRTINSAAAVGRLAENLGVSTEELSAWQGVMRRMGGDASDADGALAGIVTTLEQFRLYGNSASTPFLQFLGITPGDLENPTEALLKMADAMAKLDPRTASEVGRGLGFSPTMVTTLRQGRAEIEALLETQRSINVVTEDESKKAQEAQRQFSEAVQSLEATGRMLVTELAPAMRDLAKGLTQFLGWLKDHDMFGEKDDTSNGVWVVPNSPIDRALNFLRIPHETGPPAGAGPAQSGGAGLMRSPGGAAALGGRSGAAPRPGDVAGAAAFFRSKGWPEEAAWGIAAGLYSESRLDPNAVNPTSGAKGVGQWLSKDRVAALHRLYGPNPTYQQQLEFVHWELNNTERRAGAGIYNADRDTALRRFVYDYERPGEIDAPGNIRRGRNALARAASAAAPVTINAPITVNARSNDPQGIAREVARSVPPVLQGIVPQVNTGLQ